MYFLLIVTGLFVFLQPPLSGDELRRRWGVLDTIDPAAITVPVLPEDMAGPSFYDDLLISWTLPPDALLVITDDLPREIANRAIGLARDLPERNLAVLLTAPRHDPTDAGRIAAAVTQIPADVPRIFVAPADQTRWRLSVPGHVAPVWFVRIASTFTDVSIDTAQLNASFLGYGRRDPPLHAVLSRGIPAARLSVDAADHLEDALSQLLLGLATTGDAHRGDEQNFLLLPLPTTVIVGELHLVLGLIGLVAVLLLYSIILPRRVRHYMRSIVRNLPAIFISFSVIVVSLMAANLAIRLVGRIPRITPDPLLLVGGKTAVAVIVMSVLAGLLGHRIRSATAVYSGTAVFFLLLGTILAGAVSVVFGAYLAVPFTFGVLFSLGKNVWVKGVTLALALAPLLLLVIGLSAAADQHMATALITPPLGREVITAILLLPMLLMFFRLDAIASRTPLLLLLAMFATVGLALVVASLLTSVRNPDPYALVLEDRFSPEDNGTNETVPFIGERRITAGAAIIPERVTIHIPGEPLYVCERIPCVQDLDAGPPPLSITLGSARRLDRYTIEWRVTYREEAESVNVVLDTDSPVQLYATDVPTDQAVGSRGTRFTFSLGPFPPDETGGTITIRAEEETPRVTLTATSRFPGFAAIPDPKWSLRHRGRRWTVQESIVLE